MYCDQCGKEIDDDSRFCRHCGSAQKTSGGDPVSDKSAETNESLVPRESTGKSKGGLILGVIVGLVILLLIADSFNRTPPGGEDSNAAALDPNVEMAIANIQAAQAGLSENAPSSSGDPWSYSTDEDKVRGGTSYFASNTSTNTIHQAPPYDGATSMEITIRKSPTHGTDVILTISSGQMMCPSYEGCSGTVRFNDDVAQQIRFAGPADSSSETIFVQGAGSFIAKLKKSKKVIIEKTLYQAGNPQFEFNTSGLKWDH
jgi:hypothetical protein